MRLSLAACAAFAASPAWAAAPVSPAGSECLALPPVLRGVGYQACDRDGTAFRTTGFTADQEGVLRFTLEGPAAGDAVVTARRTPLRHGYLLEWTIACNGPPREWNGWTSGFRCEFGAAPTGARQGVAVRWVKPSGSRPWEVPGDTPYPEAEFQTRVTQFGETALAVVADRHDPDWLYGNRLERAPFSRFSLPREPPCQATCRMAFLLMPAGRAQPEVLAAEAAGRPLALALRTGRLGNLFRPGETASLEVEVTNVTGQTQAGVLEIEGWTYRGERVLQAREPVEVGPDASRIAPYAVTCAERGVVFVAARVRWDVGEIEQRTTLGVLPEREAEGTRPESPFALAAVIASPERYPDQAQPEAVLALAERIGVRWLRSGWVPFSANPTPAEAEAVQARAALHERYGILPYAQVGASVPKEADDAASVRERVAGTVRLRWGSPYLEVGNELNYSARPDEYVERLLRPVWDTMRRERPEGRVVSMGLGGVARDWFEGFVAAGGMSFLDVLAVHPGCHPRAPEYDEGWDGWVFRPQMARALHAARAAGKAVWIDEAYAPAAPARSQLDLRTAADYLVRTYVCAVALGVERIAWYQFQDGVWFARRPDPEDLEYNFGILYTDLSPKPAYVAYGAMTERLEGARCEGRLDLGAEDLYGFRFRRGEAVTDVLWSYRERHETDLPWWPPDKYAACSRRPAEPWVERWQSGASVNLPAAGPTVTVIDLMGNPRTHEAAGGTVTLRLTGSPVYVQGLGPVPLLGKVWPEMP